MSSSKIFSLWSLWNKIGRDQPSSRERKQYYKFGKTLGSGTFGEVKHAIFIPTNQEVAVKIIKKSSLKGDEAMVKSEIAVVESLDHPNIVKLLDWFESKTKYYLVFQLCTGGELFEKICERGNFTEKDAVPIIHIAYSAVDYLHSLNIVHRDIKPENFLFLNKEPSSQLVLADFGISKIMTCDDQVLSTICGSYGYTAPEIILRQGYGKPVDVWSLGVVTFSILCGYSPFWKYEQLPELVNAMQRGVIEFDERYWWGISEEAKDFIRKCLDPNPTTRITAHECLQHPWFTGVSASSHDILPNVRENFNPRKAFYNAVSKIKAMNRLRSGTHHSDESSSSNSSPAPDSTSSFQAQAQSQSQSGAQP